jgi:uncharacterized FlaG/YvyC family protein
MDITAMSRGVPDMHAPTPVANPDQAAENRQVVKAVKAVNGAEMFGEENELRFARDSVTNKMVMRVVNRETSEVISQVPEEYVLRLAEDIKRSG